jgi:hypothetical protein
MLEERTSFDAKVVRRQYISIGPAIAVPTVPMSTASTDAGPAGIAGKRNARLQQRPG